MPRRQGTTINPSFTKHARRRLRQPLTPEEALLWQHIRNRQLGGYYFRRQHGIGPYIVDFCCAARQLVIEVDGIQHEAPAARVYDLERSSYLQSLGFRVLRFTNADVRSRLPEVLRQIAEALAP